MARFSSSFTILFLRQNHKNPNLHIRNITAGGAGGSDGGGELIRTKDQISSDIDKHENFTKVAKDVSKYLRSRPRWEQTLVSEFSGVDFSDSKFLHELLKHQSNAMLKVRFFYWVTSRFGFPNDENLYKLFFKSLVETKAANIAINFLELTKYNPHSFSLELFACCLCENGQEGYMIFIDPRDRGYAPGIFMYITMIRCLCKMKWHGDARKLLCEMIDKGMKPREHTYIDLIDGDVGVWYSQ